MDGGNSGGPPLEFKNGPGKSPGFLVGYLVDSIVSGAPCPEIPFR